MFYLVRGNTKNSSISIGRDGDFSKIAEAVDTLRQAGFRDIAVLDAMGREIDLAALQVGTVPQVGAVPQVDATRLENTRSAPRSS